MKVKIKPAALLAEEYRQNEEFERAIEGVMSVIERAASEGRRKCLFDPRPVHLYEAVKKEFERSGYYFAPVGRIGGVWQDCENICW